MLKLNTRSLLAPPTPPKKRDGKRFRERSPTT